MITVKLDIHDRQMIAMAAKAREFNSKRRGDNPAKRFDKSMTPLEMNVMGIKGELAVAKLLNMFWSAGTSIETGPDVGKNIQIRAINSGKNHSLIIRPDDKDHEIFFLTEVFAETVDVIGYIDAKSAKIDEFKRAPNGREGAWFVPRNYLSPCDPGFVWR